MRALTFIIAAAVAASMAGPKPFPMPLVRNGEVAVYKHGHEGKHSNGGGWAAELNDRFQPTGYTQRIVAAGGEILWTRTETLAGGGRREMKCRIKDGASVRVLNWSDTIYSPSGKPTTKIEEDFTEPSLKYPEDMIPSILFPFLVRGSDFKDGQLHSSRLWHGPMSFSAGSWQVKGRKVVKVEAGQFDCYEVEAAILIEGDGMIANTLQKLMPKLYYYLNVEAPHQLIRFQMTVPGEGTFYDELVKFEPGG